MSHWALIIMLVVSPGPNDWIKIVPMASQKACNDAIWNRGHPAKDNDAPFDNGRISLMCVEVPVSFQP